jgi:hypothetical protein
MPIMLKPSWNSTTFSSLYSHGYKNALIALFKETKDRNTGILGDNMQGRSKKDTRRTSQGSDQEDLKDSIQCAYWLRSLTHLLWCIAHLRMLHQHLQLLTTANLLRVKFNHLILSLLTPQQQQVHLVRMQMRIGSGPRG